MMQCDDSDLVKISNLDQIELTQSWFNDDVSIDITQQTLQSCHNNEPIVGLKCRGGHKHMRSLLAMFTTILWWCEIEDVVTAAAADNTCPRHCRCGNDEVICANRNLVEAPTSYPPNTRKIDLSGNPITHIQTDNLHNLKKLQVLNLSGSGIEEVFTYVSPFPPSLQHLDLSENRLKTIPVFYKANQNLVTLSLRSNLVDWIEAHTFLPLSNLKSLDLSELRHLTKMSSKAMIGLAGLAELKMENCQFYEIPKIISKANGLRGLQKLSLSGNRLKNIEADAFRGVPALKWLNISYNYLITIDSNAFQSLTKLQTLDLRENRISNLPADVFDYNPVLLEVMLTSNQWLCNCSLLEFVRMLKMKLAHDTCDKMAANKICAKCSAGNYLNGKFLTEIDSELNTSCSVGSMSSAGVINPDPCQKKRNKDRSQKIDIGNKSDNEHSLDDGSYRVTLSSGEKSGITWSSIELRTTNDKGCGLPDVVPSSPYEQLTTLKVPQKLTTTKQQVIRYTLPSDYNTISNSNILNHSENTTKTIVGCMTALLLLVVVLLLVYYRVKARARQRSDQQSSDIKEQISDPHRSNRSEKTEALYRLHNETAANKKSPLNNNDDVIVMNKQPFSDVSKIPPVPNSQQQHRWNPTQPTFEATTIRLDSVTKQKNNLGWANTLVRQNSDLDRPATSSRKLPVTLTAAEIPSVSSQQLLNTIATSFSELETLKRFAQLPGRGDATRQVSTARRQQRLQHASYSVHDKERFEHSCFYSNPQLWKDHNRSSSNTLFDQRALPSYLKHASSRSNTATSSKHHHSNMTLPLSYNDQLKTSVAIPIVFRDSNNETTI